MPRMYFINKLTPALTAAAALLLGAGQAQAHWVAAWTAPPHAPLGTGGPFAAASYDDVTLSQVLRLSEGGPRLRVRFTNRYGESPLHIAEARIVRLDDAGNEIAGTSRPLTFGGEAGAVIPRGSPFASDVVELATSDFDKVKVEFYLPQETGAYTGHLTGLDTLAVSPPGNYVGKPFEPAATGQHRHAVLPIDRRDVGRKRRQRDAQFGQRNRRLRHDRSNDRRSGRGKTAARRRGFEFALRRRGRWVQADVDDLGERQHGPLFGGDRPVGLPGEKQQRDLQRRERHRQPEIRPRDRFTLIGKTSRP